MTAYAAGSDLEGVLSALRCVRKLGIDSPGLTIGPGLLSVLDLPAETSTMQARPIVRRQLLALARKLDDRLRVSYLEAAGFSDRSPAGVGERLDRGANRLKMSKRTVRRYADQAELAIANLMVAQKADPSRDDRDWVITKVHCTLDLRHSEPWITMQRTLSPSSHSIKKFSEKLSFPQMTGAHDIVYHTLEGCAVNTQKRLGPTTWDIELELPREVSFGEHHSFSVSIGLPNHDAMQPLVGFFPRTTSLDASVDIRFGARRPARVESFEHAVPVGTFTQEQVVRQLDPALPVHRGHFPRMTPGLTYGMRWIWGLKAAQT